MGLRRDRESKAANAARRSAKAPATHKLKPAPPVTDCTKCSKLKAAKSEIERLSLEVRRLVEMNRARVAAALAGGPVVLSDAEIAETIASVYIALSAGSEDGDRLKAAQMVTERVAGKVKDRVEHSGSIAALSDDELAEKALRLLGVAVASK
jgi:hypothetical protein